MSTVRTYLLVQTVDDIVQWENDMPVFVLDDNEHLLQTNQPHKTKDDPKWAKFWQRYEELSEVYGKV